MRSLVPLVIKVEFDWNSNKYGFSVDGHILKYNRYSKEWGPIPFEGAYHIDSLEKIGLNPSFLKAALHAWRSATKHPSEVF